jgi:integrase
MIVERGSEHWNQHIKPVLGHVPVTKLKAAHLSELYVRLGVEQPRYTKHVKRAEGTSRERIRLGKPLGPNTVLRIHRILHRLLKWAMRQALVGPNATDAVEAPKAGPSPARALTADQVAALLAAAEDTSHYPSFGLAARSAMRRSEVGGLVWSAIDFERGVVNVRQAVGEDRFGHQEH